MKWRGPFSFDMHESVDQYYLRDKRHLALRLYGEWVSLLTQDLWGIRPKAIGLKSLAKDTEAFSKSHREVKVALTHVESTLKSGASHIADLIDKIAKGKSMVAQECVETMREIERSVAELIEGLSKANLSTFDSVIKKTSTAFVPVLAELKGMARLAEEKLERIGSRMSISGRTRSGPVRLTICFVIAYAAIVAGVIITKDYGKVSEQTAVNIVETAGMMILAFAGFISGTAIIQYFRRK